ncbi:MAG: hypothetical protein RLZZ546_618 [Bacteroidota bacterium]|jgi:ligand-binding sensor domain-containing protein
MKRGVILSDKYLSNIFIALLLISIFSYTCLAQSFQTLSEHYTIEDGLSQNSIYNITQSSNGILWLATHDGLNSFDGTHFQVFHPSTKDKVNRSSIVYSVTTLKNDDLLVGTANELLYFSTKTLKYYPTNTKFKNLNLPSSSVNKIFCDKKDNIWILTLNNGAFVYSYKKEKLIPLFQNENDRQQMRSICENENGEVFVSTNDEVYKINEDFSAFLLSIKSKQNLKEIRAIAFHNKKLLICTSNEYPMLYSKKNNDEYIFEKQITSLPKDITVIRNTKDKILWFGSRSKGSIAVDTNFMFIPNLNSEENNSLFVLDIFEDKYKNTWHGYSGNGLVKLLNYPQIFEKYVPNQLTSTAKDNMILSITTEDDINYYMGTLSSGLLYFNSKTKKSQCFKEGLSSEARNIYGMQFDGKYIWLASWAGLLRFDKNIKTFELFNHNLNNKLYSVLKIPNTNYLLVSGENGVDYFNTSTLKYEMPDFIQSKTRPNHIIRHMEVQANDEIWMATSNNGFMKFSKEGVFTQFPELQKISTVTNHFYVSNNTLLIATDKGLLETDAKKLKVRKHWNKLTGLVNNFIYAVCTDKYKNIWLSSNRGISQINNSNYRIYNYDTKDGLQNLEFNTASISLSKENNQMHFGGIQGFNIINIDSLHIESPLTIPIITDIKVMSKAIKTDTAFYHHQTLNLKYYQSIVAMEFIAPNPISKEDVMYKYKMTGIDEDWVDAHQRTYASYTQLSPGEYSFLVKSYDKHGNASPIKKLNIIIHKAWWQKIWFIVTAILGLAYLIFSMAKYRMRKMHELNDINLKLSEFELSSLQESMNPHFIFNVLNSISSMVLLKENNNASKYLTKFASYLRNTIEMSQNPHSSIKLALEQAVRYLEMESLRIPGLTYSIKINPEVNLIQSEMPTYLLQPLLENIIWEVGTSSKETKIHIEVNNNNDLKIRIDIFVKDLSNNSIYHFNEDGKVIQNLYKKINLMKIKYENDISINAINSKSNTENGQCLIQIFIDEKKFNS